jgi:hypothetical protein
MCPPTLTARSRALWEGLADVPAEFGPVLRVAVSPTSRLCPPRWVGIVVIADAVLATAPTADTAHTVQQALGTLPAASLTDPGTLSARLQLGEMLGPARLAYLHPAEFRPHYGPVAVEQVLPRDEGRASSSRPATSRMSKRAASRRSRPRHSPSGTMERLSPPRATATGRARRRTCRC